MEHQTIYQDIAERTGGDIYIGVVGPVRTGKSTFIKTIYGEPCDPQYPERSSGRERAVDELPQSAAGTHHYDHRAQVHSRGGSGASALDDGAAFRVRMIDCVGYIVPSSIGLYGKRAAPHGA